MNRGKQTKWGYDKMQSIKWILLGNAILMTVILIHLFLERPLLTDFIGLVGLFFVFRGFYPENKD